MLSPNFQVASFTVEEYNTLPVSISYKFKGTEKVVSKELFKVGSSFPSTKSVTFENKMGGADLMIHYAENAPVMAGIPTQIAQYEISTGKADEKMEKSSFTMRVSNNIHNIACLDEAELIQEWTEIEKIPVKASPTVAPPKDAKDAKEGDKKEEAEVIQPEQQFETKERKKKIFSQLKFTSQSFALSPAQRTAFFETEKSLKAEDDEILEVKMYRNTLEAYSYEMRSNLQEYGNWVKYLDDATKAAFIKDINEVVEWLYDAGEDAPKQEYKTRLDRFKAIGEPVRARYNYYDELPVYYNQFEKQIELIHNRVEAIEYLSDL